MSTKNLQVEWEILNGALKKWDGWVVIGLSQLIIKSSDRLLYEELSASQ
jgi:hypothetical protein